MFRTYIVSKQQLAVFVTAIGLVLYTPSQVFALGFAEPPAISDREKAHRNIIFTGGGGSSSDSGVSCSVTPGAEIPTNFSLGTDPKERRVNLVKALMSQYGLTAEQASGPVGNFMHESGGQHLPPDVNEGGRAGPPSFSGGYGWAQWTGGRQTAFIDYAVQNGYMESKDVNATDAADLAYLVHELNTGYKATVTELKNKGTPTDAAVSFEATFERAGVPALENRTKYAEQVFNEYTEGGEADAAQAVDPAASPQGTCNGSPTPTQEYGEVVFPLKTTKAAVQERNPGNFKTTANDSHPNYTAYDIMIAGGTEVIAFMPGKVSYFFNDVCNGDSVVVYNQQYNIAISYMHLQPGSINLSMNQDVALGQKIGIVGSGLANCNGDHLHIDASTDRIRQPCSRQSCSPEVQSHFREMGSALFQAYQQLP